MIHGSWGFDCSCPANLRGVLHSLFSPAYWGPLPPYPRLPFLLVVTRLSPLSPALVAQPPSRLSSSHFRLIRHTGSHTLFIRSFAPEIIVYYKTGIGHPWQ